MLPEFSAERVTLELIQRLELQRPALVNDRAAVEKTVDEGLATVAKAYREAELPPAYLVALDKELRAIVPAAWQAIAQRYSQASTWRDGDPIARLTYVFIGLAIGGFCVWAPFIPIWEKWFPFAMAFGAWWLPDAQTSWQRRRYARALGGIARRVGLLQPTLEGMVSTDELLLPSNEGKGEPK